jgi:hypothetical protein
MHHYMQQKLDAVNIMCGLSWFLALKVCNLYLWRNKEKPPPLKKKDFPQTQKSVQIFKPG